MAGFRLPTRLSEVIDRSHAVSFSYDDRRVMGFQGDTIASALYASGVDVLSRSFKYHRPRGLLCCVGRCPNCMMNVDGTPNVRSCTTPAIDGVLVRHQNAWPSPEHDVLSFLDRLDRFLPVGFYYKTMIRPKFLWHLCEPIIRRLAGLGKVDPDHRDATVYQHRNLFADVVIVGGGLAGCTAAIRAATAGLRVVLADDQPSLGGHTRYHTRPITDTGEYADLPGFEVALLLARKIDAFPNITLLSGASAYGLDEGNSLAVNCGTEAVKVRFKNLILATGAQEVPLVFSNNDLPGIILGSAALKLINMYAVSPGQRGVVVTANDHGLTAALELLDAGVNVVTVADSRPQPTNFGFQDQLRSRGVDVLSGFTIRSARGSGGVSEAQLVPVDDSSSGNSEVVVPCDFIVVSVGFDPITSLIAQGESAVSYDSCLGESVPQRLEDKYFAVGDVTGIHDAGIAVDQGDLAALEIVSTVNIESHDYKTQDIADLKSLVSEKERLYRTNLTENDNRVMEGGKGKKFVCICEDVTEKDIHWAIAEGFDEMQTLKRYSTTSMGPCQGKMCLKSLSAICALGTGKTISETGTTTSRPPSQPVPMGVIAGPGHMPVRLTPIHHRHIELGAEMVEIGEWKRPHSYGSPQDEVMAVRERVGIIDVSTLGKLDVQGEDVPWLMDQVYTHNFSNLRPGRVRYGLMCSDAGIILDDGTVTRLDQDHYYVTTGTGNIDLVEQWFRWWTSGIRNCVHVANVTHGFAAINIAGPKARETLSKLTNIDLSTDAFRYMSSTSGYVAGIPALIMRIGFVGETGWEIHVAAEYGESLWDALLDAGLGFGIMPFGVEAQRVLRLEKKHIIPGQDTDVVTNPLEADMSWAVKFDKADFIGRSALKEIRDRGLREKLVGFVMENDQIPSDGVPVLRHGQPVGKVTSARMSPTLGKGFGLAWVPIDLADDGTRLDIQFGDRIASAVVQDAPVYDPDGKRLRE
ncbi:FAD-dependent oxidoreductase [SAR202 cluster bacterium AD-804-J14_MRT_500m]|nr:FAD-dependent oxidoreductase [SAR202 cluster bacterium AD-804-J14_MRT_500m]